MSTISLSPAHGQSTNDHFKMLDNLSCLYELEQRVYYAMGHIVRLKRSHEQHIEHTVKWEP